MYFTKGFSQVATSQFCNFPIVQFPKRQRPKSVTAAALGTLACSSRSTPLPIAACHNK